MAILDSLVTDLSATRAILRSRRPASWRRSTLITYARLRGRYILLDRLMRRGITSERIAGVTMWAGEFANLMFLFLEIFVHDEYAFSTDAQTPTIIDCGANIGMATLYFKRLYPGSRVIAFEPSPPTFEHLRRNVGGLEGVEVRNQAIAGRPGTLELFLDRDHPTSPMASSSRGRVEGDPVTVEATTLSSVITGPVQFLKVDIEGSEMEALEDLEGSGKLRLVEQMAIEYHHHLKPDDDRFSRLLLLLERNGFGYQVRAAPPSLYRRGTFQDILVYAYQLGGEPPDARVSAHVAVSRA